MSDSARHSWICGKRNTSNKAVDLVRGADVLVENYRGRKLGELGLSPETVAELRPGIIYASLRGFGWEGPWLDRGGFDMDANCATGFAALEETADAPQLPATVILNDYLAGSDLAGCSGGAGPTGKVRGSYHVRTSLYPSPCGTRTWESSTAPTCSTPSANGSISTSQPAGFEVDGAFGKQVRLEPGITYSKTPGYW
jgi:hypothetical protein